jgi:hypothetical protein
MSVSVDLIERLSRAARPTLFDGVAQPDLLISLVLANLMSPLLWDFRQRIQEHIQRQHPEQGARVLSEVQAYVNAHLYHLAPMDVDELCGLLPLDEERARVGASYVDYAVGTIVDHLEALRDVGALHPNQDIVPMTRKGLFPEYDYSIIDVIHAHCRHLHRTKHKPFGMTSCADETILICALAVALGLIPFTEIVILGAPVHYSAMLAMSGQSCWINAKKESFDRDGWRDAVSSSAGHSIQDVFDARADLDRIITPGGDAVFPSGSSTLPRPCLEQILDRIEAFFGIRLRQIAAIATGSIRYEDPAISRDDMRAIDHAEDADAIRHAVNALALRYPGTAMERAPYSFRDLSVRHPEAYLVAALRGRRARGVAATCFSIDDAIERTRAIEGRESILGDRERISLPDEVILFGTGTERDKSLLLFTLITLAEGIPPAVRQDCEVYLTTTQSYVRTGPDWWVADRWEKVSPPAQPAVVRWTSDREERP